MLLYDYVCENCGILKEEIVNSINEEVFCGECGNRMVREFPSPKVHMSIEWHVMNKRGHLKEQLPPPKESLGSNKRKFPGSSKIGSTD